jgi:hypothetical protein
VAAYVDKMKDMKDEKSIVRIRRLFHSFSRPGLRSSAASRLSNRTPQARKLMNELRLQETGRSCGGESKNPKSKTKI